MCVSNDPTSPAGFGVGTGKVTPSDYTSTSRGNPGYRNPSVIGVQGCNRMPALADSAREQRCYRVGEMLEPPTGGGWGKSPSLLLLGGKED